MDTIKDETIVIDNETQFIDPDEEKGLSTFTSACLIGFGAFFGGIGRFGIYQLLANFNDFHAATLCVNLLGAFLLGFLLDYLSALGPDTAWRLKTRLMIGTGFMGGFTTYGTFISEVIKGVHTNLTFSLSYVTVSLTMGILAGLLGCMCANKLTHKEGETC